MTSQQLFDKKLTFCYWYLKPHNNVIIHSTNQILLTELSLQSFFKSGSAKSLVAKVPHGVK